MSGGSSPRGLSGTGTAPQGSGHGPTADRAQGALGQRPQAHGVTLRESCAGPGIGLDDPDGSLSFFLHHFRA